MKIVKYKTRYRITLSNAEYGKLRELIYDWQSFNDYEGDAVKGKDKYTNAFAPVQKFSDRFIDCIELDKTKKE